MSLQMLGILVERKVRFLIYDSISMISLVLPGKVNFQLEAGLWYPSQHTKVTTMRSRSRSLSSFFESSPRIPWAKNFMFFLLFIRPCDAIYRP